MIGTTSQPVFDFKSYLADRRDVVDAMLDEFLPGKDPDTLWQSMRYSVLSNGKRIRALLAIASFETIARSNVNSNSSDNGSIYHTGSALKEHIDKVLPLACAIEFIHAMSLIHDDLPCLDNDDMRRGKPTNHKVYGEAMALLAGDALLMRAIEILICSTDIQTDQMALLDITREMARATGAEGMVGGQVFDLEYTGEGSAGKQLDEQVIRKIHAGKTGALIKFSLWSGARLAGASSNQLAAMEKFGSLIGLAFQIADDLLDVVGDKETLGKTPGKDQAANKATWVSIFGIDGARQKLKELENDGKRILIEEKLVSENWPILESLLEFAIHRTK